MSEDEYLGHKVPDGLTKYQFVCNLESIAEMCNTSIENVLRAKEQGCVSMFEFQEFLKGVMGIK